MRLVSCALPIITLEYQTGVLGGLVAKTRGYVLGLICSSPPEGAFPSQKATAESTQRVYAHFDASRRENVLGSSRDKKRRHAHSGEGGWSACYVTPGLNYERERGVESGASIIDGIGK